MFLGQHLTLHCLSVPPTLVMETPPLPPRGWQVGSTSVLLTRRHRSSVGLLRGLLPVSPEGGCRVAVPALDAQRFWFIGLQEARAVTLFQVPRVSGICTQAQEPVLQSLPALLCAQKLSQS